MARTKYDYEHKAVKAARDRVTNIIDTLSPDELVKAVKNAPSLRGMLIGYISELKFAEYIYSLNFTNIHRPDDHDRQSNKADLCFRYKNSDVRVQLKSIQTNSLGWDIAQNILKAQVQNDGSDKREVILPTGHSVVTTNYKSGDYDILAVPIFPFTGAWKFAYMLNKDCRLTTSSKYSAEERQYLLATTENITYPLKHPWSDDLIATLDRFVEDTKSTKV